jgi:NADH dehydrogenase
MAGQIAEIARDTRKDFRNIDTKQTRVLLVEAGDRVLASFPPKLSKRATHSLVNLGVTPLLNKAVTDITPDGVTMGDEHVSSATVIWAAGVLAAGVSSSLAEASGAETDRVGRLLVEPDLSLPGHPEVLAIGDMVQIRGAATLPGVAPVAMQMGRYAAKLVKGRLRGKDVGPFKYKDKGNLATIGRGRAVAELPPHIRAWGFPAWALWLGIHLFYLVGFQNRLLVFIRWGFSFLTHGRGTRLITGEQNMP